MHGRKHDSSLGQLFVFLNMIEGDCSIWLDLRVASS